MASFSPVQEKGKTMYLYPGGRTKENDPFPWWEDPKSLSPAWGGTVILILPLGREDPMGSFPLPSGRTEWDPSPGRTEGGRYEKSSPGGRTRTRTLSSPGGRHEKSYLPPDGGEAGKVFLPPGEDENENSFLPLGARHEKSFFPLEGE